MTDLGPPSCDICLAWPIAAVPMALVLMGGTEMIRLTLALTALAWGVRLFLNI